MDSHSVLYGTPTNYTNYVGLYNTNLTIILTAYSSGFIRVSLYL